MERLSKKIQAVLDGGTITRWDIDQWLDQAKVMEQALDDRPRSTRSHPSTSDWDGTIEGLKKKQRSVHYVFTRVTEPMDAVTFQSVYTGWADTLTVPTQSPSGLRARTAELVDLGVLEVVDKLGVSPTGRRAQRIGVA